MPPIVHGFDPPERFVAGTVGEPGERTFFLQAREGARVVSVALEKQQVAALAERVDELLDEVMAEAHTESVIPAVAPVGLDRRGPARPADRRGVPGRHDDAVLGPAGRARGHRGVPGG